MSEEESEVRGGFSGFNNWAEWLRQVSGQERETKGQGWKGGWVPLPGCKQRGKGEGHAGS